MFLLVGWLVRWLVGMLVGLVGLSGFQAPTGRQNRTVYMSKEPSRPRNEPRGCYFRIQPHPGGIKGAEAPLENSNTRQILPILMKFEL